MFKTQVPCLPIWYVTLLETKLHSQLQYCFGNCQHRMWTIWNFRRTDHSIQEQKRIVSARDTISFCKSLLLQTVYPLFNSKIAPLFEINNHNLNWTLREYFHSIVLVSLMKYNFWFVLFCFSIVSHIQHVLYSHTKMNYTTSVMRFRFISLLG